MNTRCRFWGIAGLFACVLSCALSARSEAVVIALAGDSTVTNDLGWGGALEGFLLDDVVVTNKAVSGRSTKSFINEGHWQSTLNLNADYVFIQFGHNDQKLDRSIGTYAVDDPAGVTPGTLDLFRGNLRRMVDEVQARGGTPVLVTSVARRSRLDDGTGIFNNETLGASDGLGNSYSLYDYATAAIAVGSEKDVAVIDLNQLSLDLYNQMLANGEDVNSFNPTATDYTHFNATGAQAIAELVANAIPNALPGSNLTTVPEPSATLMLATLALVGILGWKRNAKR